MSSSHSTEREKSLEEALHDINKANLKGVVPESMWQDLLDQYFAIDPRNDPESESDSGGENEDEGGLNAEKRSKKNNGHVLEARSDIPPVTVDPGTEALCSDIDGDPVINPELEWEKVESFRCTCKLYENGPCYKNFTIEEIIDRRLQMQALTKDEKDMFLFGILSTITDNSGTLSGSKKSKATLEKERQHQRSYYSIGTRRICRDTFGFIYMVWPGKLTALHKWYKEEGVTPRVRQTNGKSNNPRTLRLVDIRRLVNFVNAYAEDHALILPGRCSTHSRDDLQLLPSSTTKADVHVLYKQAMEKKGYRAVAYSTFRKLWNQLLPRIVVSRPMTDLCWECQKNNRSISNSSNLPVIVKEAKLKKQQQHLQLVQQERKVLQDMVGNCKESCGPDVKLCPNPECSWDKVVHYSFDFAQQVHLPHDPQQAGPIYFLVPRKVGIFGVCCEGIPQQVNYLIDEAHCSNKGSNAVISYLHHFFTNYGLGEKEVNLHCDNCSGQNKNNHVLAYFMWRVITGKHKEITLNFLITGHTKFAPDWCFGLCKQCFKRTPVSSLQELKSCFEKSTQSGVNIGQFVGTDDGQVLVPSYDWHDHLSKHFKALTGIKKYHHFRFTSKELGVVYAKEHATAEEIRFQLLKVPLTTLPKEDPEPIPSPGLSPARQWYLFESIREFCAPGTEDILCPKPLEPKPSSKKGTQLELETEEPNVQTDVALSLAPVGAGCKDSSPAQPRALKKGPPKSKRAAEPNPGTRNKNKKKKN